MYLQGCSCVISKGFVRNLQSC